VCATRKQRLCDGSAIIGAIHKGILMVPGSDKPQLGLFDEEPPPLETGAGVAWPESARFPLNIGRKRRVGDEVLPDLRNSKRPLVVVGYSALDHLIDLLADIGDGDVHVRLLFGSEPFPSRRERFELTQSNVPREVEEYWLKRGISLRLSGKLIRARDMLRAGRVQARYLGTSHVRLHAKMYCGDSAITLGSSNFTDPGLKRQIEANVRFAVDKDRKRFSEASLIAENFWNQGTDYSKALADLLDQLLRVVSWQEALARACGELLEGDWARDYLQHQLMPGDLPLWPSQVQGIAQALWLMETVGSVLVADATGSGKTRMGVYLLRSVVDRIWGSGRKRKGRPVLICPPAVAQNWEREATRCAGGLGLDIQSHGSLSQAGSEIRDNAREAIRRAQILSVDEAHNFLNPNSRRTRLLLGNMSDHTVLFTATPINRSVSDLLRLADLLGADNFDEDTLKLFQRLVTRRGKFASLARDELTQLRAAIQRFTVRRTKRQLNDMVDAEPGAYRDANGRQCRYPEHQTSVYSLEESGPDRAIAVQIREQAEALTGIALIKQPIEMPEVLLREGWSEEKYLSARLLAARKLAEYLVMSALRSSRAALLEHLLGTEAALAAADLEGHAKRQATGNIIGSLEALAGSAPGSKLSVEVPAWLVESPAHHEQAVRELSIYKSIKNLALSLSPDRETTKAQHILGLLPEHDQIIAFDSKPITLAYIAQILRSKLPYKQVILATGENVAGKKRVRQSLAPGSTIKGIVALCSDAMSEGVNLQQASAVVHLDMPSVVRIAEQRVGRVDRMDSPHDKIEAWWPDDTEEFALRRDDRFIERYETVESLLGSNMPLPPELSSGADRAVVSAKALALEYERESANASWDGVQDAFAPVRALVKGADALVDVATYQHYRKVSARVVSRVGLVKSAKPWGFFCVGGTRIGAPHWVFIDPSQGQPLTQIGEIAEALRTRLGPEAESLEFDDHAASELDRMLNRLAQSERLLLPRRKQRALEEMEYVLAHYLKDRRHPLAREERLKLQQILSVFGQEYRARSVDWDDVAERWLELVRPVWYEGLRKRKRARPLTLKDIRTELLGAKRLEPSAIIREFESVEALPALDERVVSCVLGVAERSSRQATVQDGR
jgi:superfamily II DNA or RNA helicase